MAERVAFNRAERAAKLAADKLEIENNLAEPIVPSVIHHQSGRICSKFL
jgi:hypothetical protein